jgi:hypothetical protein
MSANAGTRVWRGAFAALAVCAIAGSTRAATPKPPSPDPRDISGVWFGIGNQDPNNGRFLPLEGGEPPFKPQAAAIQKKRADRAAAGDPESQPADLCYPHGVPAVIRLPTPLQIIQTPGQVTIIVEASRTVRPIRLDDTHPANLKPTFMGDSVGHWEGDTLVVDTIGLRPNWLDISGAPASERMHTVERFRKLDGGRKLEDVVTIDDPVNYTHPWTARREYLWSPGERVQEYVCEESLTVEPGYPRSLETK